MAPRSASSEPAYYMLQWGKSHPPKHRVLVVQPWGGYSGDEELGAVGARSCIGHGQREGPVMPQASTELILKFSAPYALAPCAIPCMPSNTNLSVLRCPDLQ